jgi:hypothetical protein
LAEFPSILLGLERATPHRIWIRWGVALALNSGDFPDCELPTMILHIRLYELVKLLWCD